MRPEIFLLLIIHLIMITRDGHAQLRPGRIVSGDFQRFDVDNLGNLYVLTQTNQLRKYTPEGDSVGVFNDVVRYGRLRNMDVSNPLRIVLFYPDFGTILLLDRMLKPMDAIDLRKSSMMQVSAVAASYDNHCWVFDEQEARLRKIDAQGRLLLESPDLRMIMDDVPRPIHLSDQQGTVSMYDPARGLYIFDLYGAFQQRIPLEGCLDVRVSGKTVEGICSGQVLTYDLKTGRSSTTPPPINAHNIRKIIFQSAASYVLDREGILRFPRRTGDNY